MSLNDEADKFNEILVGLWNEAIELAAKAAYDSDYVWTDADAIADGIRAEILKLKKETK